MPPRRRHRVEPVAIEPSAGGPRRRDVVRQQQVDLGAGQAAVGQVAADADCQLSRRVEIGERAPPLVPRQKPQQRRALAPRRSASIRLSRPPDRAFADLAGPAMIELGAAEAVPGRPPNSSARPRSASRAATCRPVPGRPARGRRAARMPDGPSTITWRTSSAVSPTSAIDPAPPLSASIRTHSAPARVLPKPRPGIISQTRRPSGGNCAGRAHSSEARTSPPASAGVSAARKPVNRRRFGRFQPAPPCGGEAWPRNCSSFSVSSGPGRCQTRSRVAVRKRCGRRARSRNISSASE